MAFCLSYVTKELFSSKVLLGCKMEKSRDNLQFTAKHKVESKKDFDRGKKLTQKKEFQPV